MSIADRLPGMTLPELTRLAANARRLAEGAPGRQQDQARELLPLLEAEIAARREGRKRTVDKAPKESLPRDAKPRPPRAPKPPKTQSEKADALLAGIDEALARRP